MNKKIFSIIGGDLRIVKLAQMLAKDNTKVYTYGLEKAEELSKIENITFCKNLKEVCGNDIVVSSIPLSSDLENINSPFSNEKIVIKDVIENLKDKTFIAGNIKEDTRKIAVQNNVKIVDVLKREELTVFNAIATAEGTIQIAMEETSKTIHGSKILILGFGRIGKILAKMLSGIGAKVYCEARKYEDFAWIEAYGYEKINIENLKENLKSYDIIINTIPTIILDEALLKEVNKECLIIDIASSPGGIDREKAKQLGLKVIWALSLPGKVAPVTSAKYIKETLYNILKEM